MKTRLLLLVALALLAAAAAFAAGGLLTNADFTARAAGSEKLPAGWVLDDAAKALYFSVNDDGYSGAHSLHYQAAAGAPAARVIQTITCEKNTTYFVTAALKSDGACRPRVQVFARDLDRSVVSLVSRGEKTWKLYTSEFNSGAATKLEVQLYGDEAMTSAAQATVGTAAFDDIQIYARADAPKELTGAAAFVPPGPNLALKKPYTFGSQPNYGLCADPGDSTQLTDGEYTAGYFWAQKTTVGWQNAAPVTVTIDLGKIEPIAGLSYNTAGGIAGVAWPNNLLILVSDDGNTWSTAGDLMQLATKDGMPSAESYSIHRFATADLKTRGRFVKLFVDAAPYIFVDEIEVYRGPDSLLAAAPGEVVKDPRSLFDRMRVRNAMILRLRTDLAAARKAIAETKELSAAQRANFQDRTDLIAAEIEAIPTQVDPQLKAILPLHPAQEHIYALYATLHRVRGLSGLVAWSNNRWDPLNPTQPPADKPRAVPALSVSLMQSEYRATAFNLTNTTDEPLSLNLNVNLAGTANPEWVSVREVLFTDTREMSPIAAALPEADKGPLGYRLRVPAGMTRQVWLQVHPLDVKAGEYQGEVAVTGSRGVTVKLPLAIHVSPLEFPAAPSISIGGWDYLNGNGTYDVNPQNIAPMIKSLTEHFVDSPWANSAVQPRDVKFDADGKVIQAKFEAWDEWVGKWPGARNYAVFLSMPGYFQGEAMGTPGFNRKVGGWITAWVEHMQTQGLKPEQLLLLIYDEPSTKEGVEIIVNWARAIKAAQPKVTIFEDPTFKNPADGDPAMYQVCDILCPNLPMALEGGKSFRDFYQAYRAQGKTLWYYSCSGPGKLLDPIYYHRSQFWHAVRDGAKGSFYWAFGDEAGASSFKPYLANRTAYSPLFVTEDDVIDGKHMEAIREGAEDYEYFVMLGAKVTALEQAGVKSPLLAEAKRLLTDLPIQVTAPIVSSKLGWLQDSDRSLMDTGRLQVLVMLEKLSKL